MKASSAPSPEQPFETALRRLEAIVEELEGGETDLDTALLRYEEGVSLARGCLARLKDAELRVQQLTLE